MTTVFGRVFAHIGEETTIELESLATEGAIYSYLYLEDDDQEPTYVRIRFQPAEIVRYVSGVWAFEQFSKALGSAGEESAALEAVEDPAVIKDVLQYNAWAESTEQPIAFCLAAFLGFDLEKLVCSAVPGRFEIVGRTYDHDRRHLVREMVSSLPDCATYLGRSGKSGLHDIELTKEEQVRDLLFTMLRGVFPDAQVEDHTERQAGSSKRIDITLRGVKTAIELKFARQSNRSRIVDELKVDIESYHNHSATGLLLCVVWDPDRVISDRSVVAHDLSGKRTRDGRSFNVDVLFYP